LKPELYWPVSLEINKNIWWGFDQRKRNKGALWNLWRNFFYIEWSVVIHAILQRSCVKRGTFARNCEKSRKWLMEVMTPRSHTLTFFARQLGKEDDVCEFSDRNLKYKFLGWPRDSTPTFYHQIFFWQWGWHLQIFRSTPRISSKKFRETAPRGPPQTLLLKDSIDVNICLRNFILISRVMEPVGERKND
jgi:hypothetical protein